MKISRRKENLLVFFKNLAMTLTVVGVVSVLVFLTQGWRLDEKFEVEQTGLVQFNSSILNSIAEIDKKRLPEGTPTKILAKPGIHKDSENVFKRSEKRMLKLVKFCGSIMRG